MFSESPAASDARWTNLPESNVEITSEHIPAGGRHFRTTWKPDDPPAARDMYCVLFSVGSSLGPTFCAVHPFGQHRKLLDVSDCQCAVLSVFWTAASDQTPGGAELTIGMRNIKTNAICVDDSKRVPAVDTCF